MVRDDWCTNKPKSGIHPLKTDCVLANEVHVDGQLTLYGLQKAKEVAEKKRLEEERRAEQEAARIKRENDIRMQRIKAESEERRLVEERQRLSELQRAREEEERKLAERLEQDAIRKKEEKEITKEEVSSCLEYLIETICEVESVLAQIIDDTINAESIEIGNGSEKVMAIEEEIKLQQVQKMTNDNE